MQQGHGFNTVAFYVVMRIGITVIRRKEDDDLAACPDSNGCFLIDHPLLLILVSLIDDVTACTTWDDWINEGFAEYSALLYLKTLFGTEAFDRHLASKREAIVNTPPVWGLNRHDLSEEGSFQVIENVLYNKGPVLLADLETRIGLDSLLDLCRELLALEKLDTENLLIVLERIGGLEAAEEFEKALGREL